MRTTGNTLSFFRRKSFRENVTIFENSWIKVTSFWYFSAFQALSSTSSSTDFTSCSDLVLGEIAAEFNDVMFFIAACYKSQVDLSYLCLQSQKVSFQHAPFVPQTAHTSMESAFSGAELQSTLYHTEPGMRHSDGKTGEPMFAFAIKVSSVTNKNIKVISFHR